MLLENEVEDQKNKLNDQFNILYDSFKPVNVIKDVFNEVVTSEDFRANLLTASLGISTGYLTKKILFKNSTSPLKGITGNLIQYGIANLVVHPSRTLKSVVLPLLGLLLNKGQRKQ